MVGVAIAAVLLGIAAVVVAESLKPDAEKVLTGGVYLKDGFRAAVIVSGAALAALGALLLLLSAVDANGPAVRTTFAVVCVLGAVVLGEGAMTLIAVIGKHQTGTPTSTGWMRMTPPTASRTPPTAPPDLHPAFDGTRFWRKETAPA